MDELRDQIEAFVIGRISLSQLDEWLVPRFRALKMDSLEAEIVARVLMGLQHIADGIESEEDVREQLSSYLIERDTTSANRTLRMRWRVA